MPRKPDAANLGNPIRKLRGQLRLTQDKLGELLGMNGDAIRNLENGRIKLSVNIERRILLALGAEYRHKRKVWFVALSQTPCSPATLFAWRQAGEPDEELKRNDYKCLSYRIGALLASAKPRQYHMLFTQIYEFLDDCLNEHPSPEVLSAFKKSVPKMGVIRRSGTPPIAYEDRLVTYDEFVEGPDGPDVVQREKVERWPVIISQITRNYQKFPVGRFTQKPRRSKRQPSEA
jgi:transcriptional regulator with XRE-family HTH domain